VLDETDRTLDLCFEPHIRSAQGFATNSCFDANLHCGTSSFVVMSDSVKIVWLEGSPPSHAITPTTGVCAPSSIALGRIEGSPATPRIGSGDFVGTQHWHCYFFPLSFIK